MGIILEQSHIAPAPQGPNEEFSTDSKLQEARNANKFTDISSSLKDIESFSNPSQGSSSSTQTDEQFARDHLLDWLKEKMLKMNEDNGIMNDAFINQFFIYVEQPNRSGELWKKLNELSDLYLSYGGDYIEEVSKIIYDVIYNAFRNIIAGTMSIYGSFEPHKMFTSFDAIYNHPILAEINKKITEMKDGNQQNNIKTSNEIFNDTVTKIESYISTKIQKGETLLKGETRTHFQNDLRTAVQSIVKTKLTSLYTNAPKITPGIPYHKSISNIQSDMDTFARSLIPSNGAITNTAIKGILQKLIYNILDEKSRAQSTSFTYDQAKEIVNSASSKDVSGSNGVTWKVYYNSYQNFDNYISTWLTFYDVDLKNRINAISNAIGISTQVHFNNIGIKEETDPSNLLDFRISGAVTIDGSEYFIGVNGDGSGKISIDQSTAQEIFKATLQHSFQVPYAPTEGSNFQGSEILLPLSIYNEWTSNGLSSSNKYDLSKFVISEDTLGLLRGFVKGVDFKTLPDFLRKEIIDNIFNHHIYIEEYYDIKIQFESNIQKQGFFSTGHVRVFLYSKNTNQNIESFEIPVTFIDVEKFNLYNIINKLTTDIGDKEENFGYYEVTQTGNIFNAGHEWTGDEFNAFYKRYTMNSNKWPRDFDFTNSLVNGLLSVITTNVQSFDKTSLVTIRITLNLNGRQIVKEITIRVPIWGTSDNKAETAALATLDTPYEEQHPPEHVEGTGSTIFEKINLLEQALEGADPDIDISVLSRKSIDGILDEFRNKINDMGDVAKEIADSLASILTGKLTNYELISMLEDLKLVIPKDYHEKDSTFPKQVSGSENVDEDIYNKLSGNPLFQKLIKQVHEYAKSLGYENDWHIKMIDWHIDDYYEYGYKGIVGKLEIVIHGETFTSTSEARYAMYRVVEPNYWENEDAIRELDDKYNNIFNNDKSRNLIEAMRAFVGDSEVDRLLAKIQHIYDRSRWLLVEHTSNYSPDQIKDITDFTIYLIKLLLADFKERYKYRIPNGNWDDFGGIKTLSKVNKIAMASIAGVLGAVSMGATAIGVSTARQAITTKKLTSSKKISSASKKRIILAAVTGVLTVLSSIAMTILVFTMRGGF